MEYPIKDDVRFAYEAYQEACFLLIEERGTDMPDEEFDKFALSIARTACIVRSLRGSFDRLLQLRDELALIAGRLESISTDQSIISGRG